LSDELGIELVEAVCPEGALVDQPVLGELQALGDAGRRQTPQDYSSVAWMLLSLPVV